MIPDGWTEPLCKGVFGMLMLDTETMSHLLQDGLRRGVCPAGSVKCAEEMFRDHVLL